MGTELWLTTQQPFSPEVNMRRKQRVVVSIPHSLFMWQLHRLLSIAMIGDSQMLLVIDEVKQLMHQDVDELVSDRFANLLTQVNMARVNIRMRPFSGCTFDSDVGHVVVANRVDGENRNAQ